MLPLPVAAQAAVLHAAASSCCFMLLLRAAASCCCGAAGLPRIPDIRYSTGTSGTVPDGTGKACWSMLQVHRYSTVPAKCPHHYADSGVDADIGVNADIGVDADSH